MQKTIIEVKEVIIELLKYLEEYNNGEINYQINELKFALEVIDSDEDDSEKIKQLSIVQKDLYPPRGGLSDFYIWKENDDERIAINQPISKLGDRLWALLK